MGGNYERIWRTPSCPHGEHDAICIPIGIARTPNGPILDHIVVRERNAKDAQNALKAAPILRRYLLRASVVLRIAPQVEKAAPQLYTSYTRTPSLIPKSPIPKPQALHRVAYKLRGSDLPAPSGGRSDKTVDRGPGRGRGELEGKTLQRRIENELTTRHAWMACWLSKSTYNPQVPQTSAA